MPAYVASSTLMSRDAAGNQHTARQDHYFLLCTWRRKLAQTSSSWALLPTWAHHPPPPRPASCPPSLLEHLPLNRTISEAQPLDKLTSALKNESPLHSKDKGMGWRQRRLSTQLQRGDELIIGINYLLFLSCKVSFGFHKVLAIASWKNSQSQQEKGRK